MPPAGLVLWSVLGVVVVQRLTELRRARRNEGRARERGASEHGAGHYPAFFVLHVGWLVGWVSEAWLRGPSLSEAWLAWAAMFGGAQVLRYWAILTLGPRWNTRILVFPGLEPIARGPYRWLRHPNYVAVALELCAVPMVFGAWITAAVFSILNAALLLGVRIPAEERALATAAQRTGAHERK
jgi:methyltransferase